MDTCKTDSRLEFEWQTNLPSILHNLKDKLLSVSNNTIKTDQTSKTLTTGAICMICILTCFATFSVAGSVITAFEYFYERNAKENEVNGAKHSKKVINGEYRKKKYQNYSNDGIIKKIKRFLKCFCFVTNGRSILARKASDGKEISCVHGIKIFYLCWAIFFHTCLFYFSSIKNLEDQGQILGTTFMKAVSRGDYLNDAFFTLGGLLNAFSFAQDYKKKRGNILWFRFYMKRLMRVVPLYMIVLGFYATLFPYFDSGPLWPKYATNPICKKNWWWNLLFINNFLTAQNQCMIWTWYLATDIQFYLIVPLLMVPLCRWPKLGYTLAGVSICGSCLSVFWITKTLNLTIDLFKIGFHLSDVPRFIDRSFETFNYLTDKLYTRTSSYLVGILLGHYLSNRKIGNFTERNPMFLSCGWIITAVLMWICFFTSGYPEELLEKFAVHNGIKHLLFAVGLSWLIFACSTGHAEFINSSLSWHGFVILSRLSYCAYLLNFFVVEYYFFRLTGILDFSVEHMVTVTAYVIFWTFIASFILSAVIEIPVSKLYSMLTSKRKSE